jgi:alkane 1-monooxygenase
MTPEFAMLRFCLITLGLVVALTLGLGLGGLWALCALVYVTVFAWLMDRLGTADVPDHPGAEFPAGNGLLVVIGLAQFALLFWGLQRIALGQFTFWEQAVLFVALSLFLGQVGNPAAHELIHRSRRTLHRLGVAMYSSVLFGHHASAHVLVHHVHAASDQDPNSARFGEGFYHFAGRAWLGSLVLGYRAESKRRGFRGNPYRIYALLSLAALALAYGIAGWSGVLIHLGLSVYAQIQLFLSDYVQHYGLRRQLRPNRRLEPVGPGHSWNAPHGFTAGLMLNAPRHSDHHAHPARAYPGLVLDRATMPILPYSLPVMAVIALLPRVWRRVMDRRVLAWNAQVAQ